jgi:hypothetical protein
MDLGFTFSLKFVAITAAFTKLVADLFASLLTLFAGVDTCIARLVDDFLNTDFSLAGLGAPSATYRTFHGEHVRFLGPRAAAAVDGDASEHAMLGLTTRNHAGDDVFVDEGDLGLAVRREHAFHAVAVAAAAEAAGATAAASLGSTSSGSAGASHVREAHARAAHAMGAHLGADDESVHIKPAWAKACVDATGTVQHHAEPCAASAFAAAVACSAAEEHHAQRAAAVFGSDIHAEDAAKYAGKHAAKHARARQTCVMSLNTLASKRCVAAARTAPVLTTCAATLRAALPCSDQCSAAMESMATRCRTFVPRSEHDSIDNDVSSVFHTAACQSTVHAVQSACDGTSDGFCAGLLEPTPPSFISEFAHHPVMQRGLFWSDQNVAGVVPKHLCESTGGHIDLRGNRLVGSVPGCVWAQDNGATAVHLSRNMLSGSVGQLGAHVKHLYVNDNRLTGDLHAALGAAAALEHLDVSDNQLMGTLGFLHGKSDVRHVGISGNEFTDSTGEPVVERVLAKLGNLRSYDIEGNAFHPATPRASNPRAIHVVLRLRNDIAVLCPNLGPEAHEWNCGAMLEGIPKVDVNTGEATSAADGSLLAAIDCAVRAAVERAAAASRAGRSSKHGRSASSSSSGSIVSGFRRERVMPFMSADRAQHLTLVSFTVELNQDVDAATVAAVKRSLAPSSSSSTSSLAASAAGLGSSYSGSGSNPNACGAKTAFLQKVEVEHVEARGGCPAGLMGPKCSYACMTKWSRVDEGVQHGSSSPVHDVDHVRSGGHGDDSRSSRSGSAAMLGSYPHDDSESGPASAATAVSFMRQIGEGDDDQHRKTGLAHEVDKMVVHLWEGEYADKHELAASTESCVSVCRGHANRAIDTCRDWTNAKADRTARFACAAALGDMGETCGLTRSLDNGCRGGHASYTRRAQQREDEDGEHGCQVCGRGLLTLVHLVSRFCQPFFSLSRFVKPFCQPFLSLKLGRPPEFPQNVLT